MREFDINNLAKNINNYSNVSVAYIINELKLTENNTFKLNFNYVGCDIYKVNLMFDNLYYQVQ